MEVDVFKRKTATGEQETSASWFSKISFAKIFYYIAAFFITRPQILGGMMPFGLSLFAAEYVCTAPLPIGALMLISVGLVSKNALYIVKYLAAAILFMSLAKRFPDALLSSPVRRGALMLICIITSTFLILWGNTILIYDLIMMVVEGLLVFGLTVAYANAKRIIYTRSLSTAAKGEDLISLSVLAASIILGLGNNTVFFGINITQVLCVFASLIFSYRGNASSGAIAGIAIGLTAGIADGEIASVLGAFAISSLASGFFSKYGKTACLLSFITTNSIITLYTFGSSEVIINLYEIFIAGTFFIMLPASLINKISFDTSSVSPSRSQEILCRELAMLSSSLTDVAKTFSRISEEKLLGVDTATASFFDRTVKSVCDSCPRAELCWKKEFHRTYTSLFVLLKLCEKNGSIKPANLPYGLSQKCLCVNKLVSTFNNIYDIYKVDKLWESRITEARTMVVRQLDAIAHTIDKTAIRLKTGTVFDKRSETALIARLCESGIPVKNVNIFESGKSVVVDIDFRSGTDINSQKVLEAVNLQLGRKMLISSFGNDSLRLVPCDGHSLQIGHAVSSKETDCGDSFGYIYTPDGKCMIILSDGMGSGEKAKNNSKAVVDMFIYMMSAGFDTETAIDMINSVLVLKSTDTSFATVDIASIDFSKNEAEFIKIGAAPSYIRHGDSVRVISSNSLPAGITEHTNCEKIKCRLAENSIILLVSDGITDTGKINDKWIVETVGNHLSPDPFSLAEKILSKATQDTECIRDDMTVIAATIA